MKNIARRLKIASAVILFCIIAFLIFQEKLIPGNGKTIYSSDVLIDVYYSQTFLNNSIKQGIFPFWNPYVFAGIPSIPWKHLNPVKLATELLLPMNISLSIYYALQIIAASFLTFLVLKRKYDYAVSFFGSVVFGFSGIFWSRIFLGHVEYIASITYIPAIFYLFTYIYDRTQKRAVIAAVILIGLFLTGERFALFLMTAELIVAYLIFQQLLRKNNFLILLRQLKTTLIIFLAGICLSCYQLLPFSEYAFLYSTRSGGMDIKETSLGS